MVTILFCKLKFLYSLVDMYLLQPFHLFIFCTVSLYIKLPRKVATATDALVMFFSEIKSVPDKLANLHNSETAAAALLQTILKILKINLKNQWTLDKTSIIVL